MHNFPSSYSENENKPREKFAYHWRKTTTTKKEYIKRGKKYVKTKVISLQ